MDDNEALEWLDDFIGKYRKYLEPGKKNIVVLNRKRVEEMRNAYDAILRAVKGTNISVKYELFELDLTAGSIEIEGKNLYIDNIEVFKIATDAASVVEAYPILNGGVRFGFSFNDVGRVVG